VKMYLNSLVQVPVQYFTYSESMPHTGQNISIPFIYMSDLYIKKLLIYNLILSKFELVISDNIVK
jgi:hypothetical protein